MFKRLHIRLTLLCTFVSSMILILMSVICLSFSETKSRESHFSDFKINISMLVNHLESQSVISNDWLNQFRIDTGTRLDILDNGSRLIFDTLAPHPPLPMTSYLRKRANTQANIIWCKPNMSLPALYFPRMWNFLSPVKEKIIMPPSVPSPKTEVC